jgi:LysM repeat protein
MAATLTVQSGEATIVRADAGADRPLGPGGTASLQRGDAIRTGASGRALLDLGGDTSATLLPSTHVSILDLSLNPISQLSVVLLDLLAGGLHVETPIGLLPRHRVEIETQVATVGAKGGRLECGVVDAQRVRVRVDQGASTVSMGSQSIELKEGQSIEAILGQPLVVHSAIPLPRATADEALASPPTEEHIRQPTLTDREKTLFPPALTPTLPGDDLQWHTVQRGETLYGIAQRYGVAWQQIYGANRQMLASPDALQVGQKLLIPEP